jgi:SagB-type dehydrogenase family enzyme
MSYSKEEITNMIKVYRESLKPLWKELKFEETDKGKKLPKPSCVKVYENCNVIELDKEIQDVSDKNLNEVINSRRSIRIYQDQKLTFKQFSYLCLNTCQIKKYGPGYAMGVIPTGGATNSMETYIYVNKVENLEPGLYHFMKDTNNIQLINKDVTQSEVDKSINNQLRDAAVIFFWTTIPYRSEYKYSFTSHKMIAAEAGHACQNLYLLAESIDFGCVAMAAYNQELVDNLLQIGKDEFVIYAAAVGKK